MDIKVCYTSDDNYARHMAVSMASILKNASEEDKLFFYILDGGIADEKKDKIAKLKRIKEFDIRYVKIDTSVFKKFQLVQNYFSPAVYYRLMMADLLPDIDKVIYLDCDIIVCSSLKELFLQEISDYYVAGVEDIGYYWAHRFLNREFENLYINSGVMAINLKLWRNDGIGNKLIAFARETKEELTFGDQDVINKVLKGKIKLISLDWNVQSSYFEFNNITYHPLCKEIKKAKKNIKIIHYITAKKPWNSYTPLRDLYFYYLQFTSFEIKLTLKDKLNIIKEQFIYNVKNCIYITRYIISPLIRGYRKDNRIMIKIFNLIEFKIFRFKR
ncbi:glycosyltransferase family 8 protein [Elusimicrobiota bacterium]